ncbi:MAG: extracellular solute-binding protein [Treponema sp.]|jgi:ABC-type glycerol-3-phosphate transport system substrate-binding protein|nr:extracellular solute-binding protein [Treponema sp.]
MKLLRLFLAVICCLFLAPVYVTAGGNAQNGAGSPAAGGELKYDVLYIITKDRVPDKPSLLDNKLKEKFNISINWIETPSTDIETKLTLMFASGEAPDIVWQAGVNTVLAGIQKLWQDGFLAPISDYFDRMPNYRKLYDDAEWELMFDFNAAADGKIYFIPQRNYRSASHSWIYRKSDFDKLGLQFPKTIDELMTVLGKIKAAYPDSIPLAGRSKINGVVDALNNAYKISVDPLEPYIDPDTGVYKDVALFSDQFRRVLQYVNEMYKKGYIDREITTMTDQIWTERYANGKSFIEYSYAERVVWAETTMRQIDPNVKWAYTTDAVSAMPNGSFVYDYENPSVTSGPLFNVDLDEARILRMLEFMDWLATEEGSLFINMGEQGVTYQMVNGQPQFMPQMYHMNRNPDGTPEWKYGLYLSNIVQHPAYLKEVGKDINITLSREFQENPQAQFFRPIAWKYRDNAEEREVNRLKTSVKDVRDAYMTKFVMGEEDPFNNTSWSRYLSDMEKAGAKDLMTLQKTIYDRMK